MIKLPGLIDIHVHLRTPGQEHKEDFFTGTSAALTGGFTTVLDMPNNKVPITTLELLEQKIEIAKKNIVCDVGFYLGSLGDNLEEFEKVTQSVILRPKTEGSLANASSEILRPSIGGAQNDRPSVFGIKLYLNVTTGNFLIDEEKLTQIYQAWPNPVPNGAGQPILLHCEGETMPMALKVIRATGKKTHICHVSSKEELSAIIEAKNEGLPITCGVTPHHLFLTEIDAQKLGPYGHMKPYLKTQKDVDFLWQNLDKIDLIESDHAPHTKSEKESETPPFGVPGLETTLPLLLTAASEGKLAIDDIIHLCHTNPAKIFNIPTDENTYIEVDETVTYNLSPENLHTKCGWSPFAGRRVKGKVKTVYLRGEKVFEDGKILAKPGSGKIISPLL